MFRYFPGHIPSVPVFPLGFKSLEKWVQIQLLIIENIYFQILKIQNLNHY